MEIKTLLNDNRKLVVMGVLIVLIIISFVIGYSIGMNTSTIFTPTEPSVFDLLDRAH